MAADTSADNLYRTRVNTNENNRQNELNIFATTLTNTTTTEENQRTTAIATNTRNAAMADSISSGIGSVTGSAINGDYGGAVSALASTIGGIVSASITYGNAEAETNCNSAIASAQQNYNNHKTSQDATSNTFNVSYAKQQNNTVVENNTLCATNNTSASNSALTGNAGTTASKIETNASNTYSAATGNANATHKSIVGNSETGDPGNAQRQRTNTRDNAGYTNRRSVLAAQNELRDTQNRAKAQGTDSKNFKFVQIGDVHGDYAPDFHMTRGVQVKARTQNEGAIRCAGDEFARYGYKLDQIWDVQSLCLMKHFTYWKARECWVYDICETNDSANNVIGGILRNGTTVWSVPEEIGRVNPYDN